MAIGSADDFDRELGQTVKNLRMMRGLSQHQLAQPIGITFQQMQKYEKGSNRISVNRLFKIANALNLSPIDIFSIHSACPPALKRPAKSSPADWPTREHLQLIHIFQSIPKPRSQKLILEIMKLLAD